VRNETPASRIVSGGRRLPIGPKVTMAAGGLVLLLAIFMALAIGIVIGLHRGERDLIDREIPYVNAVGAAAFNAKSVANDQRGFLLSGDRAFIQRADQHAAAARAAFAEAASTASSPDQRHTIDQARSDFERWMRAAQSEFVSYQAGDRQAAISGSLGADRAIRKSYEQSLTTAQALGARSIQSTGGSVEAASWRSVRILAVCFLVALAIAFGLAFWLVRSIALPVSRLVSILSSRMPS
jgi:methyl-accepting chemotaxis protein